MMDMSATDGGMGWMMWGMSAFWLLVLIVLVLVAAALIKYLRNGTRR
jgi:tellurite resistance protein TehA-like permease